LHCVQRLDRTLGPETVAAGAVEFLKRLRG
jgi:hypothetical protein